MPVIIKAKIKGLTSSNKPQETDKPYAKAYWYDVTGWGKISVLQPIIDKITITIPVCHDDDREAIRQGLYDFANKDDWPDFKSSSSKGGYKIAVDCTDPVSGEKILIQADPKKKTIKSFLRLEFNPSKLGTEGLSKFKSRLTEMTYGSVTWDEVLSAGKATRVDVATDMVNAPLGNLLFDSKIPGKQHIYTGRGGNLETAYLGLKKTGKASDLIVYDKLQEATDKHQELGYSGIVHTRVEITKRGYTQKLSNLAEMKNLFEQVTIVHPGAPPDGTDAWVWELFMDSCRLRGMGKGLALVPEELRVIFEAKLDEASARSWQPKKLWARWSMIVMQSGLLDPVCPGPAQGTEQ